MIPHAEREEYYSCYPIKLDSSSHLCFILDHSMKIAYFDCPSGISGDMTLGALADSGVDLAAMQAGIDSLGYPTVKLVAEEVKRHAFRGLKVHVQHEPEKAHRHLHHIVEKIDASTFLTTAQKE